jgi:hypothetical protein
MDSIRPGIWGGVVTFIIILSLWLIGSLPLAIFVGKYIRLGTRHLKD